MFIRLAAVAFGVGTVMVLLLAVPLSSSGVDCGSALDPVHHANVEAFTETGGLFYPLQNPHDAPTRCAAAANDRRTVAIPVGMLALLLAGALTASAVLHKKRPARPHRRRKRMSRRLAP